MSLGNFVSALVSQGVNAAAGASKGSRQRLERQQQMEEDDKRMKANMLLVSLQNRPEWMRQGYPSQEAFDAHQVTQAGKVATVQAEGRAKYRALPKGGSTRADPRIAIEGSKIAEFQKRRAAAQKTADEPYAAQIDPAAAAAADSTAGAMADSAAVHTATRDSLAALAAPTGGGGSGPAAGILAPDPNRLYNGKTIAQWKADVLGDAAWRQAHPNHTSVELSTEMKKRAGVAP